MTAATPFGPTGASLETYLALVRELPLVMISSRDHYEAAAAMVDRLTRTPEDEADPGAEAYLEVLSDLIIAYDNAHFPSDPATDADILRGILDAQGITQTDLAERAGISKPSVSEILHGKKPFTRGIVAKLHRTFGLPLELLTVNFVRVSSAEAATVREPTKVTITTARGETVVRVRGGRTVKAAPAVRPAASSPKASKGGRRPAEAVARGSTNPSRRPDESA